MKTDELKQILENGELDVEARIKEIQKLNGKDVTAEKEKYATLVGDNEKLKKEFETYKTENEGKIADAQKNLEKLQALEKQEQERIYDDRFSKVLNGRKPLNDFTKDGISQRFKAAIEDENNKDKSDDDILKEIIGENEKDLFVSTEPKVVIPSSKTQAPPDEAKALMDAKYQGNAWYH